jgi:hypothetical protein
MAVIIDTSTPPMATTSSGVQAAMMFMAWDDSL